MMLTALTVRDFLEQVASGEPVPGGGSVAALAAALSAGLSGMVARLTLGKKDDPALDERMSSLMGTASRLMTRLAGDIDWDAAAYSAVMDAYGMPKGTEEEKAIRVETIQKALAEAARVPLSVAEAGFYLLTLAEAVVREGNPNAVTDGLTAALMARSAVLAALFNVRINLSSIKDRELVARMTAKAEILERNTAEKEKEIIELGRSMMARPA